MTTLAHPWQSDADRAADAIVSLRNDEVMRRLSRDFHDQFSPQRTDAQPTAGGIPSPANSQPHGGAFMAARSYHDE